MVARPAPGAAAVWGRHLTITCTNCTTLPASQQTHTALAWSCRDAAQFLLLFTCGGTLPGPALAALAVDLAATRCEQL